MENEQTTQLQTPQETETTTTALVPVTVDNKPEPEKKGMHLKPLICLCEAARRVFPSKQKLTLDQIKHFIRLEGFVPVQNGEDQVAFKVQGESFEIHYDGLRLCFVKIYAIPEEGMSMKAMSAACRKVTGEIYGVKSMLGKDEDGCCLRFSAESICRSYSDFSSQFHYYMGAINHCVSYQRDTYGSLLDQFPVGAEEEKPQRRKIGFVQELNRATEKSAAKADKEATQMSNHKKIGF